MDSRRFLLAVGLMIALVVVTNVLFPPVPPGPAAPAGDTTGVPLPQPGTVAAPQVAADSPAAAPADSAPAAQDTIAPLDADTVVVESPLFRFAVSTAGAAVVSAQLLRYESYAAGDGPVQLAPDGFGGLVSHRLQVGDRTIDLSRVVLEPSASSIRLAEGDSAAALTLAGTDPATGIGIAFDLTFHPDRYLIDVRARVTAAGSESRRLLIDIGPTLPFNDAVRVEDERALAFAVRGPEGVATVRLSSVDQRRILEGPLDWVVIHNKYFMAAAIRAEGGTPFGGVIAEPVPVSFAADLTATLEPGVTGDLEYRLYIGPQDQQRLASIGYQLQDANPVGYRFLRPILQPIAHAITWALVGMHNVLGLGYGWVLILFGVLIRLLLWPLNAKAMRSQMRQMELQPRIKEIQARYKNQPEQLQKEMIRLYKEEGFNPMSGCLPLLIPFPVLIALFFVFQGTIEFRGVEFLWLPDLSRADPLYLLPVLLGLSMFITQWLSTRSTKDVQPQMKFMMYFMPIIMTFIFLNFASGLNLYYASMNLASVPQQLQIMRERRAWQERRAKG